MILAGDHRVSSAAASALCAAAVFAQRQPHQRDTIGGDALRDGAVHQLQLLLVHRNVTTVSAMEVSSWGRSRDPILYNRIGLRDRDFRASNPSPWAGVDFRTARLLLRADDYPCLWATSKRKV